MIKTRAGRGFTLIEMLVVLLIMGLLAGMAAVAAQPDGKAQLRVEVERLAQLLDLAATESRLTGKSIAWTTDGPSYRFWRLSQDVGWIAIDTDALRPRTLPAGIAISNMRVENDARKLDSMRMEFDPDGRVLSFSVDMSFGDARVTVANSPLGDVRLMPTEGMAGNGPAQL